ncbi:MAG: DUF1838 domain-containing protein [Gammaproteobacteria bacterium]|nr:DUF1838 domain-containing protein [Gammaproteobacteria bacterium]
MTAQVETDDELIAREIGVELQLENGMTLREFVDQQNLTIRRIAGLINAQRNAIGCGDELAGCRARRVAMGGKWSKTQREACETERENPGWGRHTIFLPKERVILVGRRGFFTLASSVPLAVRKTRRFNGRGLMSKGQVDRRHVLAGAMAGGSALGVWLDSPALGATTATAAGPRLEDPIERARIFAKVKGSCAEETVYTFCRLHLYLWLNDGNLKPMLTMQNLNAGTWRPLPNGNYQGLIREVGVYTAFDTDDYVDHWINPVTQDKREIWPFFGGPLSVEIGAQGTVTGPEATLKPKEMRFDVMGDQLLLPNQSAFSFPNPFKPEQWPKEAGEPMFYWDSHYFFAASLSEILDPKISSAQSTVQFQNLVSFHPWLGMGRTPGRTYGKGLGTKLRSLDEMPKAPRVLLEKHAPQIFDLPSWQAPRLDFMEYMQQRKPG